MPWNALALQWMIFGIWTCFERFPDSHDPSLNALHCIEIPPSNQYENIGTPTKAAARAQARECLMFHLTAVRGGECMKGLLIWGFGTT